MASNHADALERARQILENFDLAVSHDTSKIGNCAGAKAHRNGHAPLRHAGLEDAPGILPLTANPDLARVESARPITYYFP